MHVPGVAWYAAFARAMCAPGANAGYLPLPGANMVPMQMMSEEPYTVPSFESQEPSTVESFEKNLRETFQRYIINCSNPKNGIPPNQKTIGMHADKC